MPDIHLKYGGSTARRTLNCPAWHNLAAKHAPEVERESAAARRGTFLHGLMEDIYDDKCTLQQALEQCESDGDRDALTSAYNATENYLDELGEAEYQVEAFLQVPGSPIGGSADMLIWTDDKVVILDYKFGYQPVTNRDQFLLYAYAGEESAEFKDCFGPKRELESVIIQPAVNSNALVEEHTVVERDGFIDKLIEAVEISEGGEEKGSPGEWCQYCPAALYCPAKREQAGLFLKLDPKQADDLSEAMTLVASMKEHIRAIEAEVFAVLEGGGAVEGWKLVQKESRRYWRDPDGVMKKLRYNKYTKKEMYIEEKLRSPAQVEKALKAAGAKVDLAEYIDKKSSGTTIAPESDKREAVNAVTNTPDALAKLYE